MYLVKQKLGIYVLVLMNLQKMYSWKKLKILEFVTCNFREKKKLHIWHRKRWKIQKNCAVNGFKLLIHIIIDIGCFQILFLHCIEQFICFALTDILINANILNNPCITLVIFDVTTD